MDSLLSLYLVGLALALFLIVGMIVSGTVERWRLGVASFLLGLLPLATVLFSFAWLAQGTGVEGLPGVPEVSATQGLHRNPVVVWGVFVAFGLTIGSLGLRRIRRLAEPVRIRFCGAIQRTTKAISLAFGAVLLVGMVLVMIFDPFGKS